MSNQNVQEIALYLKNEPSLPVEAEQINPLKLRGKTVQEILEIPLWYGKSQVPLAEFFKVEIRPSEKENSTFEESKNMEQDLPYVTIHGNLARFKRLGQGMGAGFMTIYGDVGFHAGAYMRGGQLTIKGYAGDWLGAHMLGGEIYVQGSAGNFVGAAYRGYTQGMNGGRIFIEGDVGIMLGARMRRGLIAVQGGTGDQPGFAMQAGTIVIAKKPGIRAGAKMVRGTLVFLESPEKLLPTFYKNCTYQPSFWKLFHRQMEKQGYHWPVGSYEAKFLRLSGDANEGGRGEILIWEKEA